MERIPKLEWHPDPTVKLLDAKNIAIDPYSHWTLAYGRDFDFNSLETIDEHGDFSFLAVVDESDFASRIKVDQSLADLLEFQIEREAPRASVIAAVAAALEKLKSQGTLSAGPRHVFRLPLRRRSVPVLPSESSSDPIEEVAFPSADLSTAPAIDPDHPLVITAVIDDHVNVLHERFRSASGTRVDFAWFQDGPVSEGMPFGREITRAEIDTGVEKYGWKGDQALLNDLGLVDFTNLGHNPLALRASHGTHVLDLAAGAGRDRPGVENWRIITVSLPSLVTFETSGVFLGIFFLMGLQYILKRARELSDALDKPAHLVVNCSYGIAGGPHDGSHIVERTIEELVSRYRRDRTIDIVLPAGNGNLDRGHAAVKADATSPSAAPDSNDGNGKKRVTLKLLWRLQPGDLTSSYLEIWLPGDAENLAMNIALPGEIRRQIPIARRPHLLSEGIKRGLPDQPVARVHLDSVGQGKQRVVVATAPTHVTDGMRRAAPAGLWRIEVSADLAVGQRIDAWIQRDASPIGSRVQGRQAYFDDPEYKRFDHQGRPLAVDPPDAQSVVRRTGTMNGVATGRTPIVVTSYVEGEQDIGATPYSGTGTPGGRGPDIAAVSERSRVLGGVMAAGTNSGSRVTVNGTSVAAPQVAHRLAEAALGRTTLTSRLPDDVREFAALDPADGRAIRIGDGWLSPAKDVIKR